MHDNYNTKHLPQLTVLCRSLCQYTICLTILTNVFERIFISYMLFYVFVCTCICRGIFLFQHFCFRWQLKPECIIHYLFSAHGLLYRLCQNGRLCQASEEVASKQLLRRNYDIPSTLNSLSISITIHKGTHLAHQASLHQCPVMFE